ncbi:hypothetical protein C1752_07257 [Acaryochloris thomasi RCC1774]|uniref:RING-type E3 ubiquitin transferase n=1 Tax=Acaryochloris thomasi RCC1774 TaxID=1764569 RepID=A0A2W1JQV3_9CYAN|nr:E3 ubiquitin ligase family protein [Acaryochloris thomasi]PZD71277.1 hypothetical protein C1752_07257 [Acaryochloris thomasi RCC1774]
MAIVGGILLVVSVVLFFVQRNAKQKLASIRQARHGTIADLQRTAQEIAAEIGSGSWRDYVKVRGDIQCARPLTSELKQVPCVYYKMTVEREYEETVTKRDDEGRTRQETERSSEIVSQNQRSTPFMLSDSTGEILVNPSDASIETVSILDEFRAESSMNSSLSFGGFSLSIGGDRAGRRTLGYRYRESILPLDQKVLVLGQVTDAQGPSGSYENTCLAIEKPTEKKQRFIVSLKSEEQLQQGVSSTAKYAFYGMLSTFVAGTILLGAGLA